MSADDRSGPSDEPPPRPGIVARALLAAIRGYQVLVSPWLPPACRFEPSCSRYAAEAVRRNGARRGSWMAARRVFRCRPGSPGGYDPVPVDVDVDEDVDVSGRASAPSAGACRGTPS